MSEWIVWMVSGGGVRHEFTTCACESEAFDVWDMNGGSWVDENGFEWRLEIEEV